MGSKDNRCVPYIILLDKYRTKIIEYLLLKMNRVEYLLEKIEELMIMTKSK